MGRTAISQDTPTADLRSVTCGKCCVIIEFRFDLMHALRIDQKFKSASTRLRHMLWIAVRSLMDGTPLPKSMDIISFIQVEKFEYGATWGYGTNRTNVKLVALVRAGSKYALLTTCREHVALHVCGTEYHGIFAAPARFRSSTRILEYLGPVAATVFSASGHATVGCNQEEA
jgi:hypothetical protein